MTATRKGGIGDSSQEGKIGDSSQPMEGAQLPSTANDLEVNLDWLMTICGQKGFSS
jgi:hypothetical protein